MEVIISKERESNKDLIYITSTLNNNLIYVNNNKYKSNNNLHYYLIFGNVMYEDNKEFSLNYNIELEYSGIKLKDEYVSVNEIYPDEKDLFIKEKLYIIMIVESSIINKESVIDILKNKIFNDNNLLDIYDNRVKINELIVMNTILISNIKYDYWRKKNGYIR